MKDPQRITFSALSSGLEVLTAYDEFDGFFAAPAVAVEVERANDERDRHVVAVGLDGASSDFGNAAVRTPDGRVFVPLYGDAYASADKWLSTLRESHLRQVQVKQQEDQA